MMMNSLPLECGVKKRILNAGKGDLLICQDGSKITFHFQTLVLDDNGDPQSPPLDDSKKLGRPMELILGKQFKMPVWEECMRTMRLEEVAEFEVKHNLVDTYPLVSKSYREFAGVSKSRGHCCGMMALTEGVGHKDLDTLLRKPNDLLFRLEILKVEQPGEYTKEAWTMNPEEKLQSVPKLKELGNQFYKKQQYDDAAKQYAEALGLLEQLLLREKPGEEEWQDLENMKIPILSNYAQCKLVQKDYYAVIDYTTRILERDKDHVKALFRRGKAYAGTWDIDLARNDFNRVAELDPSFENEIQKMLKKLNVLQKQKDDEIKAKLYGKVFSETAS